MGNLCARPRHGLGHGPLTALLAFETVPRFPRIDARTNATRMNGAGGAERFPQRPRAVPRGAVLVTLLVLGAIRTNVSNFALLETKKQEHKLLL